MLSRGLRIGLVVGIFLLLIVLGLHTVLRLYNAPEDAEFDLLNIFASTILMFFIGILVADYQIEKDSAAGSNDSGRCWRPNSPGP